MLNFETPEENSADTQINQTEPNKVSFKRFIKYLGLSVFIFLVSFYFLLFKIPNDYPVGYIQNIESGMTLQGLSKDLKNKNIINSRIAFEFFVIMSGGEKHIIQGDYLFDKKEYVFDIARRISKGEKHLAPVKITIPEGYTNVEIAVLVSSKLNKFDKAIFLKEAKEGYMFPDTYFFFTTDTEVNVLNKIKETFEKKIKDLRDDIAKSGKSEKSIIIMASIVEHEAKGDLDREYIAGILWNRIRIGMALQADAAPITYKERGLPDEPISNPGLKSIKASIYPKNSPYFFYLHDKNGDIHYARNFTEHKQNIQKYLR
ncbi:MAG: endolytic transglycosylase MltG [bacterium]|nr:endolytic transglycosylase MltG [bacterium]